jgi:O-antigen chain-terminating methyltransferase
MKALDDVRATASLAQQTALSLKRDVETLLSREPGGAVAPPPSTDLNAFKYLGFEEAFRGSADEISTRLAEYAPAFDGLSDILDVGCGRGEFLSLLRARGISARGVDTNDAMVAECQARGLDVVKADALAHLREIPDGSIGGLFASQVVEHLPPDYLAALLETAGHKVRPGGVLILETINPTCWLAFFESYIRDLTHIRALHPETLQYFVRVSGFADVRIEFKSPVADIVRLEPLARPVDSARQDFVEFVETFNDNVEKLNSRMFSYQDYAVIATRVPAST